MRVINKQDLGITSKVVKYLLEGLEKEWSQRKVSCEDWREVACMV